MKIAVLSGKGGTGKTLVSVNLAAAAKDSMYVDCDVEEPNGHLYFKPEDVKIRQVAVEIPQVDPDKCMGCRVCVDFCNYNALAWIGGNLKIFDEICHSCGGCIVLCPEEALKGKDKVIGQVQRGKSDGVTVLTGMLSPGVASGVPIIKELLKDTQEKEQTFIDCPPGSACIVMETVSVSDYCILVAEPTIFGVHNLNMVWELVTLMGKPCGVVLNKCIETENPAEKFCTEKGIDVIGSIPFDSELGLLNSNALIVARENAKYNKLFSDLLHRVTQEVGS
jgi:MinD superfamily P-loop ATPase